MQAPPSVERIRRAWQARAGGAREQAIFALFVAVLVGGAHLARVGTALARAVTAGALVIVAVLQLALALARRREAASTRLTVRRVLRATDSLLSGRAERALALAKRAEEDESVGDASLAALHFSRLVDRVSSDAVGTAATRYGQRFRALSVALLSMATLAVVMGPSRVVEGLDVLAARHGIAPLPMSLLSYARISAHPPAYTREPERSLVFGTLVELSEGTVLLVRGVSQVVGRELVVTDGTHEAPFSNDGAGGLVARYVVQKNVLLRVAARYGDVRIEEEDALEIQATPDRPPLVRVEGAPKTVRLADEDHVDVRWTAEDDHGLREVDLVLRSGAREERRVLARFDGETKTEHGGRVVASRDAFLKRAFLPISIIVEAKDNDPLEGPKWSKSAPITLVPPDVGEAEASRLAALRTVRDGLVDLLAKRLLSEQVSAAEVARTAVDAKRELATVEDRAMTVLAGTYMGLTPSAGLMAFFDGQLDRLTKAQVSPRAVEDSVLAVDAAVTATGARDATDVAKRLGDVAEEAATSARAAREREGNTEAVTRLDAALVALEKGAEHLSTLGALGQDVGSVATGDTARIRHSRTANDFVHAELAALHLAERLRRPAPSFGATTGSGRGSGVESGHGHGGGSLPPPSNAAEEWKRAAESVSQLAEEHQGALHGVESALEDAKRGEPSQAERTEAKRLADEVRKAIAPLPLPGQEFGTPRATAALAREHAAATAHALDDLALSEAKDSAESGLAALAEAEKKLDPDDSLRESFAAARRALVAARDFAKAEAERQRAEAEGRASSTVRQAGDVEQSLAERAEKLAEEPKGKEATLPHELAERLGQASSMMKEAAKALSEGHGEEGSELQRRAQRLLDQSRPDRSDEPASSRGGEGDRSNDEDEDSRGEHGERIATGGKVPPPDDKAKAAEFRKRVLDGLGKDRSERLSPAVRRYAESLLR